MQINKLTIALCSVLGLAFVPMVSQADIEPDIDQCDYIYGVHDGGLNDSQLLRYSEASGIEELGDELAGYDIEALDISTDGTLYGASSKDGENPGSLYTFDISTGAELTSNKVEGCNDLNGISFRGDGSLWGWDAKQGLVKITVTDNAATCEVKVPNETGFEIEDLTWNNAGDSLYFAYNDHGGADPDKGSDAKATHHIGQYSNGFVEWNVCDIQAPEIEALEMQNDDTLLVGYHDGGRQLTTQVDLETCNTTGGIETAYDIEGLAACPKVVAVPTSVQGAWRLHQNNQNIPYNVLNNSGRAHFKAPWNGRWLGPVFFKLSGKSLRVNGYGGGIYKWNGFLGGFQNGGRLFVKGSR
jgi:hypothetical protein